ncbi:MAG: ferredoxin [Desulfobacterales bacterium]|nr:ferredoxin [Desulfobacterales bacterium]
MKKPAVNLSECVQCGICQDLAPLVFKINEMGYVEIKELSAYPESEINECIKNCPTKCINWEDV